MNNDKLKDCIEKVTEYTKELNLSPKLFKEYQRGYDKIFHYCIDNQLFSFSSEDAQKFCQLHQTEFKEYTFKRLCKTAYTVAEYFETETFVWKRVSFSHYPISKEFEKILVDFKQTLLQHLSSGTVRGSIVIIRQFLHYLERDGICHLSDMKTEHVLCFIRGDAPNHKGSMGKLLRTVKKFVRYLRKEGIVDVDADKFLTVPARYRQKVLPCFTESEIKAIFSEIDRSSDKGRRDYAIFLIALRTGLRASDIVGLRLTDINWNEKTIYIIQKKTGKALYLPLPTDVGNAIADYILHSRYKSESPYIFLRLQGTYSTKSLEATAFNGYLKEYMKRAGIIHTSWDGKTFHALRRTAGTHMLKAGISVSTIAQILGHSNIESSKRYISLNTETLRGCCMELGMLHTGKEGLA